MTFFGFFDPRRRPWFRELHDQLSRIESQLTEVLMSEKDLQAALDGIKAGVAAAGGRVSKLVDTMASLRQQLADGAVIDHTHLDAMTAEATEIAAALTALAPEQAPAGDGGAPATV